MNFELWPQKRKIKRHRAPHHRPQNNQLDSSKGKPGGRSSRSPPRYSRTCFTQSIRGNSIFTLPFAMIALSKQQPPEEKDRSAHVHAEKRPGEVYRYKGQQPGERGGPQWANAGAGGVQANKNTVNRQKQAVAEAPDDEVHARAVPDAADRHSDDDVSIYASDADPRATQRYVDVIDQPVGQRNVPVPPEFSDVGAAVRPVKILRNLNAEETRRTDGNVGVRGEIHVDFYSVGQEPQRQHGTVGVANVRVVQVVSVGS